MPMDYFVWLATSADTDTAVVIDSGFTAQTAEARGREHVASPIETLAALGVDSTAVQRVILTHLHYDHTGNAAAFTSARYTVQEKEMAYWTGRYAGRGPNRTLASAADIAFLVDANFDGRIDWVDGDAEIVPGITVHHVGGHTPGMQVVRVATDAGHAVVASDASHFYANIEVDRPYAVVHNLPDMYAAFDTIRRLAADPSLIVAGHDPAVLERYAPAGDGLRGRAVRIA
jgi:glyoxylase-like metal-dependent hydrolase (beta-lactamase superfamily II)